MPLNAGFTPDVAEVARAEAPGPGLRDCPSRRRAVGRRAGQIVDSARAKTARQVIAQAELCRRRDQRKQAAAAAAAHE